MFFHRAAIRLAVAFILLLTLFGCSREALKKQSGPTEEQRSKLQQMVSLSEQMYQNVNNGAVLKARQSLDQLGTLVTKLHFDGITSVEGVDALTDAIVNAKRIFNAVHYQANEGVFAAAQIRLATDALTHRSQPMWLQYYKVLKEDLNRLNDSVQRNELTDAKTSLSAMNGHYSVIRPSIFISRDASLIEKTDSLLEFMQKQLDSKTISYSTLQTGIEQLSATWDEIFMKTNAQAYAPIVNETFPFIWTWIIGAIIITILSYVGWMKYKYQQGYVSVRKQGHDQSHKHV